MHKTSLKYSVVFVIFGLLSFQPLQDDEIILWQENERLSWSDFKAKPPALNGAAAVTASGITYKYRVMSDGKNTTVTFDIVTHFYPHKSWYKPKICDSLILGHEQLHFDISELYARKLKKRLSQLTFTRSNVKARVRGIYNQINNELNEFQNQYDAETDFSRDSVQQLRWNKKIEAALK